MFDLVLNDFALSYAVLIYLSIHAFCSHPVLYSSAQCYHAVIDSLFLLMLYMKWSVIQQAGDHVWVMGDLRGGEGKRAKENKEAKANFVRKQNHNEQPSISILVSTGFFCFHLVRKTQLEPTSIIIEIKCLSEKTVTKRATWSFYLLQA